MSNEKVNKDIEESERKVKKSEEAAEEMKKVIKSNKYFWLLLIYLILNTDISILLYSTNVLISEDLETDKEHLQIYSFHTPF